MRPARVPIAIFGGPGGGEVAAQIVTDVLRAGGDLDLFGYLNDQLPTGHELLEGRVIGRFLDWRVQPGEVRFAAPLHKVAEMQARARRVAELGVPESRWARLVHPTSVVARNADLAPGVMIGSHATVQPGARLAPHVAIRHGVMVGHDSRLDEFVFVGGNVTLCGRVHAEEGAYVAPGAVIREDVRIGRFATVGLGAIVLRDVPAYATVVGNPARIVRTSSRAV